MRKTQAMRLLDARGVSYTAKEYDASREFHSAEEAAALLGAEPAAVYKTLVVLRDGDSGRPMLIVVPSTHQAELKLLARAIGDKKLRMATQREAERLTGLQVGGISPLALAGRPFDVYLDESARERDRIHVSAGQRGMDVEIAVADFVTITGARWVTAVGP